MTMQNAWKKISFYTAKENIFMPWNTHNKKGINKCLFSEQDFPTFTAHVKAQNFFVLRQGVCS